MKNSILVFTWAPNSSFIFSWNPLSIQELLKRLYFKWIASRVLWPQLVRSFNRTTDILIEKWKIDSVACSLERRDYYIFAVQMCATLCIEYICHTNIFASTFCRCDSFVAITWCWCWWWCIFPKRRLHIFFFFSILLWNFPAHELYSSRRPKHIKRE